MPEDYYALLGVPKSATQEEIKKAFRTLAHKHHPDRPGGNVETFKKINGAYQVLSDPEKRRKYDQFGSGAFEGGSSGGYGAGGFDFSSMNFDMGDLGDMFGSFFGGRGAGSRGRSRGADLEVEMVLSFEEAVFGVEKEIAIAREVSCSRCAGSGAEPGTSLRTCEVCEGKGERLYTQRTILGNIQTRSVCSSCQGSGQVPSKPCSHCRGNGVERSKSPLLIRLPAGVDEGDTVRVKGGGQAAKGLPTGDLFVHVRVRPSSHFVREGDAIHSRVEIGFTQAALGTQKDIETIHGSVELTIPSGIQSGTVLRLKGKGVPRAGAPGDHFVTVMVVTPKKLSKEQKRLLEQADLR